MNFLPIVNRELRVAARLTRTYRNRMLTAAALAAVGMLMLLFGGLAPSPSVVGTAMFATLSWLLLAFCILEGLRKTADCLSEERREGTLGLLFLTDLKGYDVVLGKLAATSLPSVYALVAMLPILALSLLLGSVTQGEFWRRSLALLNVLCFSLSAGIWVSARSRHERQAVLGTAALIFIFIAGPLPAATGRVAIFSPGYGFFNTGEAAYARAPGDFWLSLLWTQFLGWGLLAWAAFSVSRIPLAEEIVAASRWKRWRERWRRWDRGDGRQRAKLRAEWLARNPAFWLAGRGMGRRLFFWVLIAVVGLAAAPTIAASGTGSLATLLTTIVIVNFVVKVRVASQACHCLAEARRNNALEMLLCTPLTVDQIIRGQIVALKQMFTVPVTLLLCVELAAWFCSLAYTGVTGGNTVFAFGASFVVAPLYISIFLLDLAALAWTGMWYGLSSKNETQATFKTVLFVVVLPSFLLVFHCFAAVYFFVWGIVCIILARDRLKSRFRALAGQQFEPHRDPGWWPFQNQPPVIPPSAVPPPIPAAMRATGPASLRRKEGRLVGR